MEHPVIQSSLFQIITFSSGVIVTFFLAAGSVCFSGAIPTIAHIPAKVSLTHEGGDLMVLTRVISAGFNPIKVVLRAGIRIHQHIIRGRLKITPYF